MNLISIRHNAVVQSAPGQPEMPYIETTKKGLTSRDGLWLAAAVSLHAGLFLMPFSPEPKNQPQMERTVLIELKVEQPVEQPFVQRELVSEPETPAPEPIEPDQRPQLMETPPDPTVQIAEQDDSEAPKVTGLNTDPAMTLSTAVLLQSAADQDWLMAPEPSTRKLGVFVPQATPGNWRSGITLEENLFNGMTVPRQVEVVDRWFSPDGAQNVVINMPSGDTVCGRGLAWAPMQPLVEHVMMFRPCGGGGKRTFEMPARYQSNADNGPIANSTTN